MQPILSIATWVSLPIDVRLKLRALFNIPRSHHVEVVDDKVRSDGTTPTDFMALTIEKMQKYLGSESTDFHKLFNEVVDKVTQEIKPVSVAMNPEPQAPTVQAVEITKPRRKYTRHAKNTQG